MDNHQVCSICGRDTHRTRRCPKLRKRKCYECGQYADHLAQECRDRKAAETAEQPEATYRVNLDVEPFGPLDFVSVDEWVDGESDEEVLEVPAPTRKRPASPGSPQAGPSRRARSRSRTPEPGPSKLVVTLVEERPSYVDTHCHIDLLKRKRIRASEWNTGGTKAASFGGVITSFAYPSLYMDNLRRAGCPRVRVLSRDLRRYSTRQLLRDSSLLPRPEDLIGAQYGCHPRHAEEWNESDDENVSSFYALRRIFLYPNAQAVRPLAVGETGLDLSDNTVPPLAIQKQVFDDHIWIASEFGVPLVLHLRGPTDFDTSLEYEAMDMLDAGLHELGRNHKVHRHCFRHSVEMANEWLERYPNTKFGITAKLLRTTSEHEIKFARTYPLEHILLETDCPHCGSRNPTDVIRVAEEIARLRGIDVRQVVQQTTQNAEEFYGITLPH